MLTLPLLLAVSAGVMPVVKPNGPFCGGYALRVSRQADPARIRPLTKEPPAKHLLAVANYDTHGCLKPRIISEQVGPPAR